MWLARTLHVIVFVFYRYNARYHALTSSHWISGRLALFSPFAIYWLKSLLSANVLYDNDQGKGKKGM